MTVMVGAQNINQVIIPAVDFIGVISDVGSDISKVFIAFHDDPVLIVTAQGSF